MSFSNPNAFYLMIILVPFIVLIVINYRKKREILSTFMSDEAFRSLGFRSGREIPFIKAFLLIISVMLFITALSGPRWGERFENLHVRGIEIVFLLDTSFSMNAEDVKPNRFIVAKDLITNIVGKLKTDYVGLITFSGTAHIQCPLTIDYDAMKILTDASSISPPEEQGTDFYEALSLAFKACQISSNSNKIIFLITDGEDQEERWKEILRKMKSEKLVVFPIGIGIPSGAPIPLRSDDGELLGWKKDNSGNMVKTKLNESVLKSIAKETGGNYFRLTNGTEMDTLINSLKSFEKKILNKKVKSIKIERFHYPLSLGIILLIIEIALIEKRMKWKRN